MVPGSPDPVGARPRRLLPTIAVVAALFLAALDMMVVVTAMPSIVADLGGMHLYSWVVATYLIASTSSYSIFGKLADVRGRRPIFLLGVGLFLAGSAACGASGDIRALIAFRAVQGLGAGAILPLALVIVADLYPLRERARIQGALSAVWGLSSVFGPVLGGFLVERLSWRWVFYVNLPVGLLSAVLIAFAFQEAHRPAHRRVDWPGAALLGSATVAALFATRIQGYAGVLLAVAMAMALGALLVVEQRAPDPILPMGLFRHPVFKAGVACRFLNGFVLYGALTFVPLHAQGVLGASPTEAGALVTPLSLGWVGAATAAGWLLLRVGYRRMIILGCACIAAGSAPLVAVDATTLPLMAVSMATMGVGMGLSMTATLLAVQNAFPRGQRGVVTSAAMFFGGTGSALGTAALGTVMVLAAGEALPAGIPAGGATATPLLAEWLRPVFVGTGLAALGTVAVAACFPGGSAAALAFREAGEDAAA